MNASVHLQNETNQLLVQTGNVSTHITLQTGGTDLWVILTAIGTIALAIIAFVQFVRTDRRTQKSNEATQKSNELYRLEMIARLRPEFSFSAPWLSYLSSDPDKLTFSCTITNIGTVAVTDLIIYYAIDTIRITPQILLGKENIIKQNKHAVHGALEPTRYHSFTEKFPPMLNQKEAWVALWLNYEYLDDIKEEAVAVFYRNFKTAETGFEWYNHKNMEKARKEIT